MLTHYIARAMQTAHYEILEDGLYYGEIPILQGVLATAESLEACRSELQEVLESWLIVKISHHELIPAIDGVSVTTEEKKIA